MQYFFQYQTIKYSISCLCFFFLPAYLFAETNLFEIHELKVSYSLEEHFTVYKDEKNTITINDFLSGKVKDDAFVQLSNAPEPKNNITYWLKLSLSSDINLNDYFISLPDANDAGFMSGNEVADAYLIRNGTLIHTYNAGNLIPRSKKAFSESVNTNTFPINISAGDSIDIYLKLFNGPFGLKTKTNFMLQQKEILSYKDFSYLHYNILFYSGIMFILFLYGLVFYFITRDYTFFWFFVCTFFFLIHSSLIYPTNPFVSLIIPEHPVLMYYVWFSFITCIMVSYWQFGRVFSHLKSHLPKWNKAVNILIISVLIFFVLQTLLLAFNSPLLTIFQLIIAPAIFLFSIIISVKLLLTKEKNIRILGIAISWLFAFQLLGIFQDIELIHFKALNFWEVAQIGSFVIMFFALANRFKQYAAEKAEAEKVKQLDKIKNNFFTNISHEFRTPLTLILGPLKQLEQNITDEAGSKKYVKMMRHNGERLLHLINQLLDLSKLESGKLHLQIAHSDISSIVKNCVYSFDSLAEQKGIHYHAHFPEEEIFGWIDKDKFQKIITNLLSNAFKYTSENGTVSVEVYQDDKRLRLSVQDNGVGIPKEQLDKIFDRFYQLNGTEGGSGIGLSLVKELVQLHKGQIAVSSETGKGAKFKLSIPITKEFYENEEFISSYDTKDVLISKSIKDETEESYFKHDELKQTTLQTILLVEDNKELSSYISDSLKHLFHIILARDGKEGCELAIQHIPDLIISDVMMPVMNGVEMTQALKNNDKTSHIPIIILTAKVTSQNKIEGLSSGADDYLIKPFDEEELIVRIQNLIEQRNKLKELYSKHIVSIVPTEINVSSHENNFLQKLKTIIEENLENELFSVVDLANALAMSRSQLHRKIKALTNLAPNEMIRNFRLERAKELLEKEAGNISEIAFMTGFASPAYFSKCFSDRFGYAPNEAKKRRQENIL